jgi:NAD(P)-dependent dehydrogenase (short-subunit alcohol dehydrogenase family)
MKKKKAIIIGATSGIGKSMAELLLREGFEVGVENTQSLTTQ